MVENFEETIPLVSLEGESIRIKIILAARSPILKGMIDDKAEKIPLPIIKSKTIKKIIEYLEYLHAGNATP